MILGRVTGSIVSTIHHDSMDGRRLLVVDKLGADGEPSGAYVIAIDTVGTGAGETVIILDEGTGARQILGESTMPVRSLVVGVVDHFAS